MQAESDQVRESPERFDPRASSAMLVDAEHRGRYWCVAALARGRDVLDAGCGTGYGTRILLDAGASSVTGVDMDDEAVAATLAATEGRAEVLQGDIHSLPFEDASFDLVVCLEVIEHVVDQDEALAQLARVLRPGGIAVVSSPNRDVYTPGNPHHVHEYVPEELRAALGELFSSVELYRQHAWLAAGVLGAQTAESAGESSRLQVRLLEAVRAGTETYTIAVATSGEQVGLDDGIVLTRPFESRWWHEQVVGRDRALEKAREREVALGDRAFELEQRLFELEQIGAEAADLRRRCEELYAEIHRLQGGLEHRDRQLARNAITIGRLQRTSPVWWAVASMRRVLGLLRR